MNHTSAMLAAISCVVSEEELLDIAGYYNYSGETSAEYFQKVLSDNNVSENQAALIYHYCYLYCKLTMMDTSVLEKIRRSFKLPLSIIQNSIKIITVKRIRFILDDFADHGKSAHEIFKENEKYITDMLTAAVVETIPFDRKLFKNLSSSEYEHPTDRAYLDNLNTNKTIEKLVKLYSEYNFERILTVQYTGSNIRVTEKNLPYLHNALKTVCKALDVKDIPPLYVTQGSLNACTIGSSKPIIVISGLCLSLLSYDELLFILGHEVGHIKSQHVLYHSIGSFLPYIAGVIGNLTLGIGELAIKGITILLYQWYRMSEITADRAGLLACQNIDAAISVMAKLSGYPPSSYDEIDNSLFLEQAVEFENFDQNVFDKLMKLLSVLYKSHPWTVMRAKELQSWYDTGAYQKIYNVEERCKEEKRVKNPANNIFGKEIFCSHCGKKILSSSRFCEFCGKENIYHK
ncbi:MAG: zinc-ribbon domain-containing protein [Ruminococcus sp.]|nr:zinc-ribbon domain-containing protein [Ruminococcus sp.]